MKRQLVREYDRSLTGELQLRALEIPVPTRAPAELKCSLTKGSDPPSRFQNFPATPRRAPLFETFQIARMHR